MFHDSYQKLKSGRFLFRITKQIILLSAPKVQFFLLEMEIDTTNLQQILLTKVRNLHFLRKKNLHKR